MTKPSSTSQKKRWRRLTSRSVLILAVGAVVLPTIKMMSLHNEVFTDLTNQQGAETPLLQPVRADVEEPKVTIVEPPKTEIAKEQKPETTEMEPTKTETVNDQEAASFPLAKSLLNKSPPFQESDIFRLSSDLTTSPNTVVTGYFRVPSKFEPGKYDGWMKNFLSLQDHMVIFTQPEMVEQVKMLRNHALDRTVIIQMKLDDLPIGTVFPTDFWERQLELDPERKAHKSYQLFWIWLSKSWCVTEAIRLNFFQSDLFVWSDIGCFRIKKYNSKTMILHRDQVPPHEMMQMAHHEPNPPAEELFNDKYTRKSNFYHSGSQFAAYKDTWKTFHEYFLETIDRFLAKDMIIVEDQAVLQSVCLSHPEICAYVPFTEVKDNHYFGLRYLLHHGGNPKLWRHPKAIEAKANQ
jgi:hypothetical protein